MDTNLMIFLGIIAAGVIGVIAVIFIMANDVPEHGDEDDSMELDQLLSSDNVIVDLTHATPKEVMESINRKKKKKFSFPNPLKKKTIKKDDPNDLSSIDKLAKQAKPAVKPATKPVAPKPAAKSFDFNELLSKIPFLKKPAMAEPSLADEAATLRQQLGLDQKGPDRSPGGFPKPETGTAAIKTPGSSYEDADFEQGLPLNSDIARLNDREEDPLPDSPQPPEPPVFKPSPLTPEEEKIIDKDLEASLESTELQQKYERVEKILKERTEELEQAKTDLDNEVKNRKEFNKVKDLLEKEISETKEKTRKAQVELASAQSEKDSYKMRISQLEDKVSKLQKAILEKEKEIEELAAKMGVSLPTKEREDVIRDDPYGITMPATVEKDTPQAPKAESIIEPSPPPVEEPLQDKENPDKFPPPIEPAEEPAPIIEFEPEPDPFSKQSGNNAQEPQFEINHTPPPPVVHEPEAEHPQEDHQPVRVSESRPEETPYEHDIEVANPPENDSHENSPLPGFKPAPPQLSIHTEPKIIRADDSVDIDFTKPLDLEKEAQRMARLQNPNAYTDDPEGDYMSLAPDITEESEEVIEGPAKGGPVLNFDTNEEAVEGPAKGGPVLNFDDYKNPSSDDDKKKK